MLAPYGEAIAAQAHEKTLLDRSTRLDGCPPPGAGAIVNRFSVALAKIPHFGDGVALKIH